MENIQTNTTVAVSSDVKYAGFWRRLTAWLIDLLILIIVSHWASLPFSSLFQSQILGVLASSSVFSAGFFLVILEELIGSFIIIGLYYCLLEASPLQATVGKYIAGIKITDSNGQRITYGKALLRRVYAILSAFIIFIGYIIAGFTPKKQTLHDMFAKTVVVVKHKRSGFALFGIVVLTLVLGVLSDMYLGAGFHISFNSPNFTYDTQNGAQNYVTEQGNQVDPTLQNLVITDFLSAKALYASGNLPAIRQHLLDGAPAGSQLQQQVTNLSDSDLQKLVAVYNQVAGLTTEDILRSPSTTWTFNQNMTVVKITFVATLPNGSPENVSVDMLETNGQWYF